MKNMFALDRELTRWGDAGLEPGSSACRLCQIRRCCRIAVLGVPPRRTETTGSTTPTLLMGGLVIAGETAWSSGSGSGLGIVTLSFFSTRSLAPFPSLFLSSLSDS